MTPITIPFHLLIAFLPGMAGLILVLIKRKAFRRKNAILYKSALIFFFTYTLLVGNALGHDLYHQWDLNQYDLNQNGLFESSEKTHEQVLAMQRLKNGAGKNSAFISAFVAAGILSLSIHTLTKISDSLIGSDEHEKPNTLNNVHIQ